MAPLSGHNHYQWSDYVHISSAQVVMKIKLFLQQLLLLHPMLSKKTAVKSYKMKNRHLNLSKHLNRVSIQLNNWPVISCLAPLFKGLFGRWLSAASITTRMDSLFGQRCVAGECFSLYSFLRPKCSSLYS